MRNLGLHSCTIHVCNAIIQTIVSCKVCIQLYWHTGILYRTMINIFRYTNNVHNGGSFLLHVYCISTMCITVNCVIGLNCIQTLNICPTLLCSLFNQLLTYCQGNRPLICLKKRFTNSSQNFVN